MQITEIKKYIYYGEKENDYRLDYGLMSAFDLLDRHTHFMAKEIENVFWERIARLSKLKLNDEQKKVLLEAAQCELLSMLNYYERCVVMAELSIEENSCSDLVFRNFEIAYKKFNYAKEILLGL